MLIYENLAKWDFANSSSPSAIVLGWQPLSSIERHEDPQQTETF
jgi:hypothetical protein